MVSRVLMETYYFYLDRRQKNSKATDIVTRIYRFDGGAAIAKADCSPECCLMPKSPENSEDDEDDPEMKLDPEEVSKRFTKLGKILKKLEAAEKAQEKKVATVET